MSTRKLSRASNTAPELSPELGTPVIHPRYHEGQKVRYKDVTERYGTDTSIGRVKTVLKDVTPPVGREEVRYEVCPDKCV
ncbi:hypothetical protein TSTA_082180 [Talaromyces stipitatus ATCC 10500]|uniref:Uncharacterized protein n=1 Tax=Talaromyces stipitatus (strain ATCC 10500 / CBS 375.48 / QM 6759 / NRRL 1006) TaxID=441959 RepID=B8M143_TALSN|nr:uncharacterized protein TSTA_082180 [Talaromyces stipitatus ATCC 10500]EED20985.1 hypothetical protein TSTA_082180 [Talaromyces stipitatus ATCC 10500]